MVLSLPIKLYKHQRGHQPASLSIITLCWSSAYHYANTANLLVHCLYMYPPQHPGGPKTLSLDITATQVVVLKALSIDTAITGWSSDSPYRHQSPWWSTDSTYRNDRNPNGLQPPPIGIASTIVFRRYTTTQ